VLGELPVGQPRGRGASLRTPRRPCRGQPYSREGFRANIKESVGPLDSLEPDSGSDSEMPELVEFVDTGGPLQVNELPDEVTAVA
jgi:hypothetical protein